MKFLIAIIVTLICAWPIKWLANYLALPFLPVLDYGHALALLILCNTLFKGRS